MESHRSSFMRLTALILFVLAASAQAAALFKTVSTADDSGTESLRSAINAINANGPDGGIISFSIGSTCGPNIIVLQSPLPNIEQEMHIEGFSQPGASANTSTAYDNASVCIIIDGALHNIDDAFFVPASVDGTVELSVQGIAFSGFSHSAITYRGGNNHLVGGVHIGGVVQGYSLAPVGYGVVIGSGVIGVTIGGEFVSGQNHSPDLAARNIIGETLNNAIYLDDATDTLDAAALTQILYNLIGVGSTANKFTNRGNVGSGIAINGFSNTVRGNVIAYNGADGIHINGINATDNTIVSNDIGLIVDNADAPTGNIGNGIRIDGNASANTIQSNTIDYNGGAGVRVVNGTSNQITRNQTYNNAALGIDLAGAGVTANDNDSQVVDIHYANRGQNFPILTRAIGGHVNGTISGSLQSTPGTYVIEFFDTTVCDASGHGQSGSYMGNKIVTIPAAGAVDGQNTVTFDFEFSDRFIGFSPIITATATDSDKNTSELSSCKTYVDDTVFADGFEPPLS